MNALLIYTPQNGEYLKTVLDAMVALLDTTTFKSAMDIMVILAVCMVGYQYVMGKKLESLMRFVVTSFFVIYCLLGIRVPVAIIDMQEASGAGRALTVDHVPLGTALPAAIISGMGYGITQVFSDVFHMPASLDYTKTGMVFGARTWLSATNTRLSTSPDLASDMSSYIRQCVFAAKLLASHQISPSDLVNSPDLLKTYFENPSPIYRVILHDGQNVSCGTAAEILKKRLNVAALLELERLGRLMTNGDKEKYSSSLAAAHDYYMKISGDAANILTQNILINATRDAASDAFAFTGADAALMNYTNTSSQQKMHVAEANSFWLASYRLPYYMTVMWMLTICIFPLIALIAFFPTMQNVYTLYLQSQAYLWSWPPMFIIIHYFVSLASSSTITMFGQKTGGVTFSNIDSLASLHSNFAYTAGALAASVPFLAYYITKGLSSVLSNAAQHFGGIAQSLSISEAQAASTGNVSMASYSGWNMNYDNHHAHKFDTNYAHASGNATAQMGNGAMLTETSNGSRIGNVMPAISHSAVHVNASDRVVDSLHQSANESFSNANQLRTSADHHLQAGLNELKNFTQNDSNDYRSGAGVSNTTTDSISQDLRKMKDAVHHHNMHHDVSGQASIEAAIAYRLNSDKAVWGKGISWVTGTSVDASVTGRATGSTTHGSQWLNNTTEGQAFNEAFNHMISTAKNNHLDASDSRNLSGAEQIAANLSSSQSLMDQASSEYSHGLQLQKAASHAVEHSANIDNNLDQAYHDWVLSKFGAHGEQVMLQTDSASIATQNQWASEFLKSNHGQQAITSQVNAALAQTGNDLKGHYQADAVHLAQSQGLKQQYARDKHKVDTANNKALTPMSAENLSTAMAAQALQRAKPMAADAVKTTATISKEVEAIDKKIIYQPLNKEK